LLGLKFFSSIPKSYEGLRWKTTPSLNACFEDFVLLEKFVVGCDEGACNRGSASGTILTSIRDSGDSGIFGESLVKSTAAMAREPRSPKFHKGVSSG
jgi:hypothetical protein